MSSFNGGDLLTWLSLFEEASSVHLEMEVIRIALQPGN